MNYYKEIKNEIINNEIVQRSIAQLPWRYNIVLMSKVKDINEKLKETHKI